MRGDITTTALLVVMAAACPFFGAAAQVLPRHFEDSADHVHIVSVERSADSDDQVVVVVAIDLGYHINANPASMPYLIPTTLNVTKPRPLRVLYPKAVRFRPKFLDDELDVYDGTIRIIAEFSRGALAQERRAAGTLTAQACTDIICLPPADLDLPDR